MEDAVLQAAEKLSQETEAVRCAEQALSYMLFFDSIERELEKKSA